MTRDEQFNGIVERLADPSTEFTPLHLSVMVIIGYLEKLQKLKIVESPFQINATGYHICDVCAEFAWIPTDSEIDDFVSHSMEPSVWNKFGELLRQYRNDPSKFEVTASEQAPNTVL
jgi:hypothetical protein